MALSEDPADLSAARPVAPVSAERLNGLLVARPDLLVDELRPTAAELQTRIAAFWLAEEVVLYIGLAGQPLRTRVRQYYRTPLGAMKPHAGGWWLKTLDILDEVWVHWAPTPDFRNAEETMLAAFAAAVDEDARARLPDNARVGPFANIRTAGAMNKRHGVPQRDRLHAKSVMAGSRPCVRKPGRPGLTARTTRYWPLPRERAKGPSVSGPTKGAAVGSREGARASGRR